MLIRISFLVLLLLTLHSSSAKFDNFTLNLYKTIAKSKANENLMISPTSIASALGLAMHGASGNTRAQIERVLIDSHEFGRLMNQIKRDNTIESANKIFVSQKFSVKESYQQITKRIYGSSAELVDFTKSVKTAGIINGFISDNTKGLITKVIDPNSITGSDVAILVNAMFFNATWVKQFDLIPNGKLNFHLSSSKSVEVPLMSSIGYYQFVELNEDKLKVMSMSYKATDINMVILLPNEVDGLRKIEKNLTVEKLNFYLRDLTQGKARVKMPRFKIETELKLVEDLKKLGITQMFDTSADFSNLIDRGGFKIDEVLHKTTIDVNERGTIAAAVTVLRGLTSGPGEPFDFTVDRPFLFLIRNKDFIFFIGRVVKPEY